MSTTPVRCRAKRPSKSRDIASRPPPAMQTSSSDLFAQQAGALRAEAVLAKSFFERVGELLTAKSAKGA